MPLIEQTEGNYIYIFDGKLTQRVPEGTEGAVTRVNKMGKTVHEKYYPSFVGKLIGISTRDGAYGKQWIFEFQDSQDSYLLQMNYSDSYASAFLKMLPNIDVTKEMKVSPQLKIEADGTKKSALFVNQDGNTVKHFYTKDNPNGMPQWEQIEVKGQLVWDDTKALKFLEEMVNRDIVPKLPKREVNNAPVNSTEPTGGLDDEFIEEEKGEELDF